MLWTDKQADIQSSKYVAHKVKVKWVPPSQILAVDPPSEKGVRTLADIRLSKFPRLALCPLSLLRVQDRANANFKDDGAPLCHHWIR